jgi:hypothetical protein
MSFSGRSFIMNRLLNSIDADLLAEFRKCVTVKELSEDEVLRRVEAAKEIEKDISPPEMKLSALLQTGRLSSGDLSSIQPRKKKSMKVFIIYGVPLSENVIGKIQEWENDGSKKFKGDWDEEELCGFSMLGRDGDDEPVGFCGVIIDTIEGNQYSRQEDLCLAPNEDEEKEANASYGKLAKELREILEQDNDNMGVCFMVVGD